jgi:hypothetical protein
MNHQRPDTRPKSQSQPTDATTAQHTSHQRTKIINRRTHPCIAIRRDNRTGGSQPC